MSSLVMEIENYELQAGVPLPISREATYFLLMTGSNVDMTLYFRGSRIGGAVGLDGGDAVGPLSQQYDKVILQSATAQSVKVATSSDPVTITRLSGVVSVSGVITTTQIPDTKNAIFSTQIFSQPSVAGNYALAGLVNPALSNKNALLNHCSVSPSGTAATGVYGRQLSIYALNSAVKGFDFNKANNPSISELGKADTATFSLTPDEILGRFSAQVDDRTTLFSGGRPVILAPGETFLVISHTADAKISTVMRWEERAI